MLAAMRTQTPLGASLREKRISYEQEGRTSFGRSRLYSELDRRGIMTDEHRRAFIEQVTEGVIPATGSLKDRYVFGEGFRRRDPVTRAEFEAVLGRQDATQPLKELLLIAELPRTNAEESQRAADQVRTLIETPFGFELRCDDSKTLAVYVLNDSDETMEFREVVISGSTAKEFEPLTPMPEYSQVSRLSGSLVPGEVLGVCLADEGRSRPEDDIILTASIPDITLPRLSD